MQSKVILQCYNFTFLSPEQARPVQSRVNVTSWNNHGLGISNSLAETPQKPIPWKSSRNLWTCHAEASTIHQNSIAKQVNIWILHSRPKWKMYCHHLPAWHLSQKNCTNDFLHHRLGKRQWFSTWYVNKEGLCFSLHTCSLQDCIRLVFL